MMMTPQLNYIHCISHLAESVKKESSSKTSSSWKWWELTSHLWASGKYVIVQQNVLWVTSTWYPFTTPESPGSTPNTDSELTMSSCGIKPRKEDLFPLHREGGVIRWLCWAPKLYAWPYWLNGWRTAVWVALSLGTHYSKQCSYSVLPLKHAIHKHQEIHMPAKSMLQRVAAIQTQKVEHPLVEMLATQDLGNRRQTP